MKKLNNNGFSAVEAVLILVIVAILAGTGFYVYKAQNNASKTLDTADKTAASQTQTIKDKQQTPSAKTQANPILIDYKASTNASAAIVDTNFSALPDAFKTAYAAHVKSTGHKCVNDSGTPLNEAGQPYDPTARYIADQFVRISECQSGAVYAYKDNSWQFVAQTQSAYRCTDLEKYSVPASLTEVGGKSQCYSVSS